MISIRTRLTLSLMTVVCITVLILEALIMNIIRETYYKGLETDLSNQVKFSAELYGRYFSDSPLEENILNNVDSFWRQTSAQVQIFDTSGRLLMDSIGIINPDSRNMEDVEEALKGRKGKWMGKVDYDDERVMAISYPLKSGEEIVGVLRFISSLREVNRDVNRIAGIFHFLGFAVVVVFSALSLLLSSTIISPLKEITLAAEKMAAGNFSVQSRKRYNDELGRLSDTLNNMAQELMNKERMKNEFISSVSHELRTPLTSIKGWAVTLKEGGIEERELVVDGLEIIERECDRLTGMVEELLDFSKFVSGKAEMKYEKVDVSGLVQQIHKQLMPRAEKENIQFRVIMDEDLPHMVTDEDRLRQVFINILDNSFKFTPPGGEVVLSVRGRTGGLEFCISDTGCGIAEDELPRVKEKFFKGRNSNSKSGIGLSICDEIIRLLDGRFEIRSEIGKGTEVCVTLPLNRG